MQQTRKDQLNIKLRQIYEHGSGRIEGVIENLLQEPILGHLYFIHEIKETVANPPCIEEDYEDKNYTLVEVGLYQEGDACIEHFDVPVSTRTLHQIAARIDAAYYRWMQREPSWMKNQPGRGMRYDYYKDLLEVIYPKTKEEQALNITTKEEFEAIPLDNQNETIDFAEWYAFLPDGGHEQ